jgi:hypothetical protein
VQQPSRSIMPGWVRAKTQARGAGIETRKVWMLTEHDRPVRATTGDQPPHRDRFARSYGFADLRLSVEPQKRIGGFP